MDTLQDVPNHINASEDEFWPLSGKPCFNVIIGKTHTRPLYHLYVPAKESTLLPPCNDNVVLTYRGKEWKTRYMVGQREGGRTCRTIIKWREFVIDNHLKEGDACVLELTECSKTLVKIRVQILKGDFPSQLLNNVDGVAPDKPIIL